jgi:hypothetical protein
VNQNVSLDGELGFLTNQPGYLLCRTRPGREATRHRGQPGITERRAHSIIADLAEAGYVITQRRPPQSRPGQTQCHDLRVPWLWSPSRLARKKCSEAIFGTGMRPGANREFVQAA